MKNRYLSGRWYYLDLYVILVCITMSLLYLSMIFVYVQSGCDFLLLESSEFQYRINSCKEKENELSNNIEVFFTDNSGEINMSNLGGESVSEGIANTNVSSITEMSPVVRLANGEYIDIRRINEYFSYICGDDKGEEIRWYSWNNFKKLIVWGNSIQAFENLKDIQGNRSVFLDVLGEDIIRENNKLNGLVGIHERLINDSKVLSTKYEECRDYLENHPHVSGIKENLKELDTLVESKLKEISRSNSYIDEIKQNLQKKNLVYRNSYKDWVLAEAKLRFFRDVNNKEPGKIIGEKLNQEFGNKVFKAWLERSSKNNSPVSTELLKELLENTSKKKFSLYNEFLKKQLEETSENNFLVTREVRRRSI